MLEIAKSDILARLRFDNPWWDEGPDGNVVYEDTPRRQYFPRFSQSIVNSDVHRAMVLMGPRRVGKTVMVYHTIRLLLDSGINAQNILYLSLETPIYTGLALERLVNYFQELFHHQRDSRLFIFFDEIQYLKAWEIHLKSLVDSFPHYQFVATGSAAAALRLKSAESGAGRFSDYILPPLTFAEYLQFIGREAELISSPDESDNADPVGHYRVLDIEALNQEFVNYLNFGGYPEAVFSNTIRQNPSQYIKSDIVDKVLLRDLPSLYGISDIQELNRLFTTLAYNSGNEVSLENLCQSSGVSKNTIKRYLEYLEAAFLIRRVERIDQNAKHFKRAVCFKVYLTNPSMRAALFGQLGINDEAMGAMTETAIFSQWQSPYLTDLYYARWKKGEVDIVHLDPARQCPAWMVEVKWSDRPYVFPSELDNCVEFVNNNPDIHQPILVTTKTLTIKDFSYKDIAFEFRPASLYAYHLGIRNRSILSG
ncbi:MAG: ATP-binding protein [Synechocystis sp.]|nr:ATP-binding protein [Synechocystis sp.]